MASRPKDPEREERIDMEIVVDAYDSEERAMSWYYYLQDHLQFPFPARCVTERRTSPLHVGDAVKVVEMAPEEECQHEMFVLTTWKRRKLAVPLSQLTGADGVDEETQQALDDWRYWVERGYEF